MQMTFLSILVTTILTTSTTSPLLPEPVPVATTAISLPQAGWTTGATGVLPDPHYTGNVTINLATQGTYDPDRWCVILDYQALTIESNTVVTFLNHPSGAPVVIRSVGPILIRGGLWVSGADAHRSVDFPFYAVPGPGGFRGGIGQGVLPSGPNSAGFGPGGAFLSASSSYDGGFAAHVIGPNGAPSSTGLPGRPYDWVLHNALIGGSGGSGGRPTAGTVGAGGGAGGGAILIGSDVSITFQHTAGTNVPSVIANGGRGTENLNGGNSAAGPGSGGTIQLAAPVVQVSGANLSELRAVGGGSATTDVPGAAGLGYIRIETASGVIPTFAASPSPVASTLGDFLPPNSPSVAVYSWWNSSTAQWEPIPLDPRSRISSPTDADVQLPASGSRIIRIRGRGVPIGAPIEVRTTFTRGNAVLDTTHTMGEDPSSTLDTSWTDVTIDFSLGVSTVQVRAVL